MLTLLEEKLFVDEAKALPIKKSALLGLGLAEEVAEQIWEFASDNHGPVVQRVTKHIMAVRCLITDRHPIGYLHFTFLSSKKEEKRFVCSCREAKVSFHMKLVIICNVMF